jgi:glycosyltransferase involved in cell wall biosynthesis
MRIAVVNNFFPPRVGGSSHLSDSLARGYAEHGHEVLVVTAAYQGSPEQEDRDGLHITRLPAVVLPETRMALNFDIAFTTRPSLRRQVARVLDSFGPDALHQHGQFFDLTWATGLWARHRGVPALLSVHTRLESPSPLTSAAFRMADATLVAPILRRYRPTFVVMDVQMDEYIRTRYADAIGGMEYIPVGVDPDWVLGGDGTRVRRQYGLGERPVVLSLGHVIPLRDRIMLVEALPMLRAAVPDVRVLVVGHVYYDEFLARAQHLGVADLVVAVGPVTRAEVPDYLAAATVEAHDLQGYGFGTASLESMAAAVPVVAAVRADNFPTVDLIDGEHCLLVPEGDVSALAHALARVIEDRDLHDLVGQRGRSLVRRHFALDVVIEQHLRVLERLASDQ